MDLSFINDYYVPLILVACLIVGYCIKNIKWLEAVSNEYIPAILAVLGAVLYCWANSTIDLETIVYGAFNGLASTGAHQMFKQWINKE